MAQVVPSKVLSKSTVIKLAALLLLSGGISSCATNAIDEALYSFTYKADTANYWQSAEITEATLQGDCEDLAFWLRDILLKEGIDPKEIEILQGELYGVSHMLIRYKGEFIDSFGRHRFYPEFVITHFWPHTTIDNLIALHAENI